MIKSVLFSCLLLFINSYKSVIAQSDTILVGYAQNDPNYSVITQALILPDYRIGLIQIALTGNTALITDTKGEIIHQRKLDEVEGFSIELISYMLDDTSSYVYIGSAIRDGKRFLISFSLDTNLQDIRLIDTLQTDAGIQVFINKLKYNTFKSGWEGFGYGREISSSNIPYICYISLNKNYEFVRFEHLTGNYHEGPVLEFQWIESLSRYFIKTFGDRSILVDENFNVIQEIAGITLIYEHNGTHITSLGVLDCLEPIDSKLFCYAKTFSNGPYSTTFATLDLQGDSIHLVEAIPLNDPPLGMDIGSNMRVDLDGNYVLSGTKGNGPSDANEIRVAKFSSVTYDKIWEFSYQSEIYFEIRDVEIDQNNDIVLVGYAEHILEDPHGLGHGFLMKVYSNGALTSFPEIPEDLSDSHWVEISPNPSASTLCLSANESPEILRLWDLNGQLMLEQQLAISHTNEPACVDLPEGLQPGLYATEVIFLDGYRTTKKIVINP